MLDVFRGLKSLIKVTNIRIDSPVFRLHYSITVMILVAFSLIVTTRQYVGNPIDCVHTKDIPEDVLNTYCWIHSTYTIKAAFKKKVGVVVPYPGVESSRGDSEDKKCYTYYQWVCFCLFFQAVLFYVPRWLWKQWEGGKIHALIMDLDVGICSELEKRQKKKLLLDYLWENLRYHNWWCYRYYLCEFLSLANVIDVPDGPVLRRGVPHVRDRRLHLPGQRPGGPGRPDDLHIPPDDQVHLLQVRGLRGGGAPRRGLHPPAERRQREDLRLPLVLVPHPRLPDHHRPPIQDNDHHEPEDAGVPAADAVQTGAPGGDRRDRAAVQDGRLVPPLHARGEHRLHHLQGRDPRAGRTSRHQATGHRSLADSLCMLPHWMFGILLMQIGDCKLQTFDGMRVDYFMPCENKDLPNKMENFSLTQLSRDKIAVNADIYIAKISRKLPALITIYKCPSRAETECEVYLRVTQKDFCPIFTESGQFWSEFYDTVKPRLSCPLKLGTYNIRNGTIDFKMLATVSPPVSSLDDSYWKFRTMLYSYPDKEELLCITGGGKPYTKKRPSRSKSRNRHQ